MKPDLKPYTQKGAIATVVKRRAEIWRLELETRRVMSRGLMSRIQKRLPTLDSYAKMVKKNGVRRGERAKQ